MLRRHVKRMSVYICDYGFIELIISYSAASGGFIHPNSIQTLGNRDSPFGGLHRFCCSELNFQIV